MTKVIVSMSMSLDGFAAGPNVSVTHAMGERGERLHTWLFEAQPGGADAEQARELTARVGAVVTGRRTFEVGIGHWGATPYPGPCFVVTHHERPDLPQEHGTFTFVTDGVARAVELARAAAGDRDVLVLGGASLVQQCLRAGLVDEIRIQLVPVLLGAGTRLFEDLGAEHIELVGTGVVASSAVTHLRFAPAGR